MPTLEFVTGKSAGTTVELKPGKQVLGLSRSAEIPVREKGIAFTHAALYLEGDKVYLEDLGSKTGTTRNGEPVNGKIELADGDRIAFGEVEAIYHHGAAPAPAPAAAAAGEQTGGGARASVLERLRRRREAQAASAEPTAGPQPAPPPAEPAEAAAPAAAEQPASEEGALSVRERLRQRRLARAGAVAAPAAAEAEDAGELKDKLRRAEIDLRRAVRELGERTRELEAARSELEAIKSGDRAAELEARLQALEQELAARDRTIEELKRAMAGAEAGVGTAALAADVEERVRRLEDELKAAQLEASKHKATVQTQLAQLERAQAEIARLKEKLAAEGPVAYSGVEEENEQLRAALEEKNLELDRLNAEILELRDANELLQRRIDEWSEEQQARRSTAEKQLEVMEQKVGEYLEAKHHAEEELARFKKEYAEFEERVLELQAQVDDLTERNEILAYRLEQADIKVGEMVREKLADMQYKYDEIVQANQQLHSLVQAYEEKIDELDTRLNELEAENAELEQLLKEEREAHERTRAEAEREQRKLRKRLELAMGEGGRTGEPSALEGAAAE
ncbi:MAG: hypothetical protein KatS3mg102_2063 [Planctomycetota bacterium]|nr:MAG: hypothetical protein KatS3mg102_2063 [Planctomycetota bacterium]